MAFPKIKTGKTINKFLAGVGIASLGTIILGAVAPGIVGSTAAKALEGIAAYGIGGLESAAGAATQIFVGQGLTSFSGPSALDNVQTESL
tara:strand:- start:318 stop:587 length:270 start_codon:yes stop_codon:yes gene_type:complete